MRIGYIIFITLLLTGCSISDMITYRYTFTDHRIVISGEKPEDMEISAQITILYRDKTCYIKNQAGGSNQPRWGEFIDADEQDGGRRYQLEVPVDLESGNCDPYFSSVSIYGQNKIYDMDLLSLKTEDHFVATCGRTLFTRETGYKFLSGPDCSLDLNGQQILAKYERGNRNETNYIPILQEHLNATTEITLDVKKDRYYQSDEKNLPPVPEGVDYYNNYRN